MVNAPVALVGDSLTDGWRTVGRTVRRAYLPHAAVFGYPGQRPEGIAAVLHLGDLHRVSGTVVVMAGINSFLLTNTPPAIAASVRRLVDVLRPQASRLVLCSILPAFIWGRNEWPRIRETNALLSDTPGVHWLDCAPLFLDGEAINPALTTDGVHLSPRGYFMWANALLPQIATAPELDDLARIVMVEALWRAKRYARSLSR